MANNIDMDVSGVIDDMETLDQAADRMFTKMLGHQEFAIHRRNPAI